MRLSTFGQPMLRRQKQTRALTQRTTPMRSPIPPRALFIDWIESPIGIMLLIHDPEERVHALDYHYYEARLRRLPRLHYGGEAGDCGLKTRTGLAAVRHARAQTGAGGLC